MSSHLSSDISTDEIIFQSVEAVSDISDSNILETKAGNGKTEYEDHELLKIDGDQFLIDTMATSETPAITLSDEFDSSGTVTSPPVNGNSFTVPITISQAGSYVFTFIPSKSALVRLLDPDGNVLASSTSIEGIRYKGKMFRGDYKVEVTYTGSKPTYTKNLVKGVIVDIDTLLEDIRLNPDKYDKVNLLNDFSTKLGKKPVQLKMDAVTVQATHSTGTITVTGDMCLTIMGESFSVNLSDGNALYLYTDHYNKMTGFDAIATVSVTIKNQDGRRNLFRFLNNGVKSLGLELHVDTKNNNYSLKGDIALRIGQGRVSDFSCTIGGANGKWDNISIKGEKLNRVILPQYQIYLQRISAYAENLSQDIQDATFGANIGFSLGPKITMAGGCPLLGVKPGTTFAAVQLDFSGEWKTSGIISGKVALDVFNGMITGNGGFTINNEGVALNGSVSMTLAGVLLSGAVSSTKAGLTITVARTQDVHLLKSDFFKTKKIGSFDWDMSTALNAELFISYDISKANSYISITGHSGNLQLNYYYNLDIGFEKKTANRKYAEVAGAVAAPGSTLSANSSPYKSASFVIKDEDAGKPISFAIDYDGSESDLAWRLVDSKGTFFYNDFVSSYENIDVSVLDGGLEIRVDNAAAGIWQLDVYGDSTSVGNCEIVAYLDNTAAQNIDLTFTSRKTELCSEGEDYTNWLYFNASVTTDFADNQYYLYEDVDAVGYDGALLGTVSLAEDGSFSVEMPVLQQGGAKYYYLVAKNDEAFDSYSNYSDQVVFEMTSSDLSVDGLTVSRNCYDESGEYCLRWTIENRGTLTAQSSISNVFLSYDQNYNSGDVLLSVDTVKALVPGEKYDDYCLFVLPEEYRNQQIYIGVYANADDSVNEQGRDLNNLTWLSFDPGDAVNSNNYGQLMTTPTWSQNGLWNKYFPKTSSSSSSRMLAGCGPIAVAQLLYSRKLIHSLSFTEEDQYSYGAIILDSNSEALDYLSFEELNSRLADIKYDYSDDEIAAFVFGIAVKLHAKFGADATSVYTTEVETALQALGFVNMKGYKTVTASVEELIKRNLAVGLPVLLSLDEPTGTAAHMAWIEDYDEMTDKYYVNFGWGGYCDTWYKLNDIYASDYHYTIDRLILNIDPENEVGLILDELEITDDGIYTSSPVTGLKSEVDDIRVDLSWDDQGSGVIYRVEYADNDQFENSKTILTTEHSCHVCQLATNGVYYWRVSVVQDGKQRSKYSDAESFAIDSFADDMIVSDTRNLLETLKSDKNLKITENGSIHSVFSRSSYAVRLTKTIAELHHHGTITVSCADEGDGIGGDVITGGVISGRIETSGQSWSNGMWVSDCYLDEFSKTSVMSVSAKTNNALGLHAYYDIKTNLNGIFVLCGKGQSLAVMTNDGSLDLTINGIIIALQNQNVSLEAYEAEAVKLLADNKYQSDLLKSVKSKKESENDLVIGYSISSNSGMADNIVFGSSSYVMGTVSVGGGDDCITVKSGAVLDGSVYVGEGNDSITVESGAVVTGYVFSDKGNDNITIESGAVVNGHVNGSMGNDTITIRSGAVVNGYVAGEGNNTFILEKNAQIEGFSFGTGTHSVTISNGAIINDWKPGASYSYASNVILSITLKIDCAESTVFFSGNVYDTVGDSSYSTSVGKSIDSFDLTSAETGSYRILSGDEFFATDYFSQKQYKVIYGSETLTIKAGETKELQDGSTVRLYIEADNSPYSPHSEMKLDFNYEDSGFVPEEEVVDEVAPVLSENYSATPLDHSVLLSWDAATDNVGVAKYAYRYATDQDSLIEAPVSYTTKLSNTLENLEFGKYFWQYTALDEAGNQSNWSEIKSFTLVQPDTGKLSAPTVTPSTTLPTNQVVILAALFDSRSAVKEYSLDNITWQAYSGDIRISENMTVWFRSADADNQYSDTVSYTVDNIDVIAPDAPGARADIIESTSGIVTVTAEFSSDTVTKEYSMDGVKWKNYLNGIVFFENGTVYFRGTDAAGNVSEVVSYDVTNITPVQDTTPPTVSNVKADITASTSQNVTVTAEFTDDVVVVSRLYKLGEDGDWTDYVDGVTVSVNTTVFFKAIDAHGNESEVVSYEVTNIDKVPPVKPSAAADITTETDGAVNVTATFSNDSEKKEYSLDGRVWLDYTEPVEFSENGTVYFRGTDAAGNVSEITSFEVTNILSSENGSSVLLYVGDQLTSQAGSMKNKVLSSSVNGNDRIDILSGGKTSNTVINAGGIQNVYSGGIAYETQINQVASGKGEFVFAGGTALKTMIDSGGIQEISGGYAVSATVRAGSQIVHNQGKADDTTVSGNGMMILSNGGIANCTVVLGGTQVVSSGGTAFSPLLSCVFLGETRTNGVQYAMNGAKIYDLCIEGGGQETRLGAVVSGGHITSGGIQIVYGQVQDMEIISGTQWIYTGGVADRITVSSGGEQLFAGSGAKASNTVLKSGGVLTFASGASAIGIVQEAGGVVAQVAVHAAAVSGTNVSGSFSCFNGVASNFILHGLMYLQSGGSALNTTVSSGGFLWMMQEENGGYASNVEIHSGGEMRVSSGTLAGNIVVHDGGQLAFTSCKSVSDAKLIFVLGNVPGEREMIYNNPYSTFCLNDMQGFSVLVSTGQQIGSYRLASNASAFNKTITVATDSEEIGTLSVGETLAYGTQFYTLSLVSNDLTLVIADTALPVDYDNVELFSSGVTVSKGKEIVSARLSSGGYDSMFVSSGGTARFTTVDQGGILNVLQDGFATDTKVLSGGSMVISATGHVSAAEIFSDAKMIIRSGASLSDLTLRGGFFDADGVYCECLTVTSGGFAYFLPDYYTNQNDSVIDTLKVESGGSAHLAEGVTLKGAVDVQGELMICGPVSAEEAAVNLDISCSTPNYSPFISDLENLNGASFTITVAHNQKTGTYNLANGIDAFTGSFIVKNDQGAEFGNYSLSDGSVELRRGAQILSFLPSYSTTQGIASTLWLTVSYDENWEGDTTLPVVSNVKADITAPTNQNVTVTADFTDDVAVASKLYRIGEDGTWTDYEGGVVVEDNATVYFKAVDSSDNESEVVNITVDNIDKVPPAKPTATADMTEATTCSVNVSAVFSGDSVKQEYSLDNGKTWQDYTAAIVFTANGTVLFRGTDAAGNTSEVVSYAVTNIDSASGQDQVKPTVSNIVASITAPTNQDVIVTADFTDDVELASSLYKLGEDGVWTAYPEDGVPVTENATVYFKAIDTAGNESEVVSITVDNIDKVPPAKPTATADMTEPTNGEVSVTAVFSDDSTVREYSFDGLSWAQYPGVVRFTANGTVYFRAADALGNVSEVGSYAVTNIDKVPPAKPTAFADITGSTGGKVTVTAVFSEDSARKEYSLDGLVWSGYTDPVVFNANGKVYFRATDAAGNMSDIISYEVTNITGTELDTTPPTITVTPNTTAPAQYVTVTAVFTDDVGVATRKYRIGDGVWMDYTGPVTVTENTLISFLAVDTSGNAKIADYDVMNIQAASQNNKPDDGWNDYLYDKKKGWNTKLDDFVDNTIFDIGEINLDPAGSVDKYNKHNMFGNDGINIDTGDVAKIDMVIAANLTFTINSTAAGAFYVYEDGFDKKGRRAQIQVAKVSVKANSTALLQNVCLSETGDYYVAMVAKNVKKNGLEGFYNVNVSKCTFFYDADDGDNNAASIGKVITVGRDTTSIVLDSYPMIDSEMFDNYVGVGDAIDYARLNLASSAYLSFSLKSDGAAKFTIWKQDVGGKLTKVGGVTTLNAKNGFKATTKMQFLDKSKYKYYISMESADAAKGGSAYYNIELKGNSKFFDSADNGKNNTLYDKKAKSFHIEDGSHHFETTSIDSGTTEVLLDSNPIGTDGYGNFVGYGDAVDYAKIELTGNGDLSFELKATGDATFVVYRKGRDKKGNETLDVLQTTKLALAKNTNSVAMSTNMLEDLDAGEYYISMTAKNTKPNDKGCVYYNVTAVFNSAVADAQLDSALAAAGFASGLESLQGDKSAWQSLTTLA